MVLSSHSQSWKARPNILHVANIPPPLLTAQQWTKRILKDFKERHADAHGNGAAPSSTTSATSTPRANKKTSTAGTPKTPRTGNGKKRATPKHEFDDDENNDTPPECSNSSAKREKTPRSNKKVKYEEPDDDEEDNGDDEEGLGGLPSYPAFQGQEEDDAFEGI